MWQTTVSCTQCEQLTIFVESDHSIKTVQELPNTYDRQEEKYSWRFHEFMGYALVPRLMDGTRGGIDLYLCIDEDDLDDIDVRGYAERFLRERILPTWKNVRMTGISDPMLATARGVKCRKLRHHVVEETR